ncbi:hypothetical protein NKG94_22180 [Micromonospora sp. M12]
MTSKWINMNVLSIDETRVVVEAQDEPMIKALRAGASPDPLQLPQLQLLRRLLPLRDSGRPPNGHPAILPGLTRALTPGETMTDGHPLDHTDGPAGS